MDEKITIYPMAKICGVGMPHNRATYLIYLEVDFYGIEPCKQVKSLWTPLYT